MTGIRDARHVHVVGVGGAGMSAVAQLLVERGVEVTGSDTHDSPRLAQLRAAGVGVHVGHDDATVRAADLVLWSPAVRDDDAELRAAREVGATLLARAELFRQLSDVGEVVGLCGTHGKTTATSMMVHVARSARRDVGWLVGAEVLGAGANGHWGAEGLIVEVDESYGTFAHLTPHALGLLNVEADHLDHYGSLDALEHAFGALVDRATGPVVAWTDDPGAARVAASRERVVRVGTRDATWCVRDVVLTRADATFTLAGPGETLGLHLAVTGAHNVANAAVVAVLARRWGLDTSSVVEGLANFVGAPRRFQLRGRWRGADVYEDYAHLPGEIAATLRTTKALGYERALVIFQPHRVSRTLALVEDFAHAFVGARDLIVTDLYDAGEMNPLDVHGDVVADAVRDAHPEIGVRYVKELASIGEVMTTFDDVDVVLVVGAGDVARVIDDFVEERA